MKKQLLLILGIVLSCAFHAKAGDGFITTWEILAEDLALTIPVDPDYAYNFTIDWGDGSTDTNVSAEIEHTYASAGVYEIEITGEYPNPYFGGEFYASNRSNFKLKTIEQWGNIKWKSMHKAFASCRFMKLFAQDNPDLSDVTNLSKMFNGAMRFNGNISSWNVSNVKDMSEMFFETDVFNQNIDSWNVSNVETMREMFVISQFNQPLNSWDVSNVEDMLQMFYSSQFNQALNSWNVSNVKDMGGMFGGSRAFNQDISSWDVSNVISMSAMFGQSLAFNQDISSWDVSNVEDMSFMFSGSFFKKNIGSWDVSNVKTMRGMFANNNSFYQEITNWDIGNVRDMGSMFSGADSIAQNIYLWDMSKVEEVDGMFMKSNFNQPIGSWDLSSIWNMSHMFEDNTVFNQDIGDWDVSNVMASSVMFKNATSFNQDISRWNTGNVIQMYRMFEGAYSFNQNISEWDTKNLVWTFSMFSNAISFNQDLSKWNVENLRIPNHMFDNSGMSSDNYDCTLIGWSKQNLQTESQAPLVPELGAVGVNYCSGKDARNKIIKEFGWTIIDAGEGSCESSAGNNLEDISSQVTLFPNPADGEEVFINLNNKEGDREITIFNMSGNILSKQFQCGNNLAIDISTLNAGIYLVEIISRETRAVKKLVRQ